MGQVRFDLRPHTAPPVRSRPVHTKNKPEPADKQPPPNLAEGRALKQTLWFPGSTASLREQDLEPARALASRAMGVQVHMHIVRINKFGGGQLALCAVCTSSHCIGCYELSDGLQGVMFRRMTDSVVRDLIGTLGPLPGVAPKYQPVNTFMGSRVFPTGTSLDSLATYVCCQSF